MQRLRAALCALVCAWAGQAAAGSSASAELVDFRWSMVDLKPDDDLPPEWNGYTRPVYGPAVCLAVNGSEECWYDEYNWMGDPQYVTRSNASASATAANARGDNLAIDPPIVSNVETAFGSTITPATGTTSFRAMTSYGYGVGVGPWTAVTLEVDVMLYATADTSTDMATAYASFTFLRRFVDISVNPLAQQGLHTLQIVVENYSDDIDWTNGIFRIELMASGQSATPVPEPSAALLLAVGLFGVFGWLHFRPAAGFVRRAAAG